MWQYGRSRYKIFAVIRGVGDYLVCKVCLLGSWHFRYLRSKWYNRNMLVVPGLNPPAMSTKGPLYLHKNTKSAAHSFICRYARVPHLYNSWHYHRELELLYVIRGDGTRYLGDSIEPFFAGELVLVGSNVPHFWQSDPHYFRGDESVYAELILTQFVPDLLGDGFELSEFQGIRQLINRAQQGITFGPEPLERAVPLLWQLAEVEAGSTRRMLLLLQLLDVLATSADYRLLSKLGSQSLLNDASSVRLREVCKFVLENYLRPIRLAEVAAVANMSEKAFCRFFKNGTQKTLVQFITELRLSHACKLLLSGDHSVSEVCFASGFNNLSNFNRAFKRITGKTPRMYRRALH